MNRKQQRGSILRGCLGQAADHAICMFVDLAQKPQAQWCLMSHFTPDPKRWMPSGDFPWRIVETGVIMINTNAVPASQSYRSMPVKAEDLRIPPRELIGSLRIPKKAFAVIVFAHGSGSSRLSPRNVAVARALNRSRHGDFVIRSD